MGEVVESLISGEKGETTTRTVGISGLGFRGWLGSCLGKSPELMDIGIKSRLGEVQGSTRGGRCHVEGRLCRTFPLETAFCDKWKESGVACFSQSRNSQNLQIETEGLESCSFLYGRMIVFAASSASAV